MAIPGRLKIYQDGSWKYVGYGPQGTSGYSGWSGWSGTGGSQGVGGSPNLMLSAQGGLPTITSGCSAQNKIETTTNDINYVTLDFTNGVNQSADWVLVLPDNYGGAGTFTAQFYWTATAGTGNVVWRIQARAFGDDEAIDQAMSTYVSVTDSYIAAGDVHVSSETATFTPTGTPAAGELCVFQVGRYGLSGSDTLAQTARLLYVKLTYTTA